jgi:hypothetical protein
VTCADEKTPLQLGDKNALEEAYEAGHVEYWAADKRRDQVGKALALSKVDQYGDRLRATHWKRE